MGTKETGRRKLPKHSRHGNTGATKQFRHCFRKEENVSIAEMLLGRPVQSPEHRVDDADLSSDARPLVYAKGINIAGDNMNDELPKDKNRAARMRFRRLTVRRWL